MKRQLNTEEKEINQRAIERLLEEVTDIKEVHLADAELTFNKKLDFSYKNQKKQYKQMINQFKADIVTKQQQINILTEQNKNGVDTKENKLV